MIIGLMTTIIPAAGLPGSVQQRIDCSPNLPP